MSERLARHSGKEAIEEAFQVSTHRDEFFEPDYNISPGSLMPVVYEENGERKIYTFQWGLIPEDADAESEGKDHFKAKSEEIEEDKWLNKCFEKRRCIIPANGFYKWKTSEKKSTPFYVRLLTREIAGFAGLYSVWQSESGRDVYSFTLLTTEANPLVQPVDDRMPVILQPDEYDTWLNKDTDMSQLKNLLQPLGMTEMAVNRVSEKVANLNSQGPELIQPIPK